MGVQGIGPGRIQDLVAGIFDEDLHAKRVVSLGNAVVGVLEGARLGVSTIGRALAVAAGLDPRHAVKQVDRLFSNDGIDVWRLFGSWVPYVIGERQEIIAALDWTDYDADDQSTLVLSMVTSHGRATPLLWKTVLKSEMKGWRNAHEDALLERFREVLPCGFRKLWPVPFRKFCPVQCAPALRAGSRGTGPQRWSRFSEAGRATTGSRASST